MRGGASGETRDVAIAVNGKIEAVSKTFYLAIDRRNEITFFEVLPSGELQAL